jgi:integral membrane protein
MNQPLPVRITGMVHGILFIAFVFYLMLVKNELKWPSKKVLLAFIASLLPFGTFVLDARVLKPELK